MDTNFSATNLSTHDFVNPQHLRLWTYSNTLEGSAGGSVPSLSPDISPSDSATSVLSPTEPVLALPQLAGCHSYDHEAERAYDAAEIPAQQFTLQSEQQNVTGTYLITEAPLLHKLLYQEPFPGMMQTHGDTDELNSNSSGPGNFSTYIMPHDVERDADDAPNAYTEPAGDGEAEVEQRPVRLPVARSSVRQMHNHYAPYARFFQDPGEAQTWLDERDEPGGDPKRNKELQEIIRNPHRYVEKLYTAMINMDDLRERASNAYKDMSSGKVPAKTIEATAWLLLVSAALVALIQDRG